MELLSILAALAIFDAAMIVGMYFVITRPIIKAFKKLPPERSPPPSAADPAAAFRTLDDQ